MYNVALVTIVNFTDFLIEKQTYFLSFILVYSELKIACKKRLQTYSELGINKLCVRTWVACFKGSKNST